jgi:hypothetical protein
MSTPANDFSSRFSREFCAGVEEACAWLEACEDADLLPPVIASECMSKLDGLSGDKRQGVMTAIAAYLGVCLSGSIPILGRWQVYREICGVFDDV